MSLVKHKKPKHLFTMPTSGMPVPGSKADGRKMSTSLCTGSVSKDRSEYSFVPEELFRALTCASSSLDSPDYLQSHQKMKNTVGFRGCLQTPDRLWHYPNRRSKFRHLTDHPVSLTGAGRDVSYLCDVVTSRGDKKTEALQSSFSQSHQEQSSGTVPSTPQATSVDSLVPKEFHIVRNQGVLPLKYFDDKYTTLLEDSKKKLRLFPSLKPSGRLEVMQLTEAMDSMLEKAGVDELIGITGPSQLHNMLELLKAEQNIYNIVFHELIRQVSVDCMERGQLLSKLRQRYVDLLERVPQQMKTLYKKMMAQRLVDRHITEELLYFKECVAQLASELCEVREHDCKVTKEAEKAQEELAAAMQEAEANANLLEQYRELYELQRRRLEDQVLMVAQERDIWSSAACDLALKIIERNQLTLVRRLHVSGKALTKVLKHFIVLLASKDLRDLADLQEETEQFKGILGHVGAEIECLEESSKEKLQTVCRSLNKWLQYHHSNFSFQMKEELWDEILEDMKLLINMLKEDIQLYAGEAYLAKTESLRSAARIQEHWTELGETVLSRHQDLTGALLPQHAALEEINRSARELYQQYNIRISGNNGTARFLTVLVRSMEDWLFKAQKLKQGSGMHQTELQTFYHMIPSWLAQVDALMSIIGSSQLHEAENDTEPHFPVVPREFFKMIQQWILSTNTEVEKSTMNLNEEVTELHRNLTLWLVNLLRYVIADRLSRECPQQQESDFETDKELRLQSAHKLQKEAEELVAKMCGLSGSIVSCCHEIVSAIVRKKRSKKDSEADLELEELNKLKTECYNWIQVCSLLLSEIKDSPISFLHLEELRNLFGSEELQLKLKDTIISSTQEGLKADDANSKKKPVTEKETLTVKEKTVLTQEQPGAGIDDLSEGDEATADMIRYIGQDSNIHLRSLKSDIISVTGREMTASKSSTPFSQKEFEALALLEHLQVQLLETEIRAQNAEQRSEDFEKKLEEALERIQELESELEKRGQVLSEATPKEGQEICLQESVSEGEACSAPKTSTSGQSKRSRKSKQ
ncbi:axonemal dynein light chain domain-containing protein 1 isoform X1 [Numida meleagris]|uniref:axonemal dynein light chain domain-containing protein 1 isoform X1 n=1 Tax=Numida meleagris TaxID=8996 RepID=UPI000B3E21BD|nr:axonemal dynein light chain domain-containing protein 1 isoform X1 [Numida meleagris]